MNILISTLNDLSKHYQVKLQGRTVVTAVILLFVIGLFSFAFIPTANAEPPEGKGPGAKGQKDLYGDLMVLYRSVDGLQFLDQLGCEQPISAEPIAGLPAITNPADGKLVSLIPLNGEAGLEDGTECDVQTIPTDYTVYLQELEFGRISVERSPDKVLAKQLGDVITAVQPPAVLTLDQAGRLVAFDGVESSTVDSPLQNLAIHQELQNFGQLTSESGEPFPLPVPSTMPAYSFLDQAAAMYGAAADKGKTVILDQIINNNRILVILDQIINNNRILDITNETVVQPTLTGDGTIGVLDELYIDYSAYAYSRSTTFPGCVTGFFIIDAQALPFSGSLMYFVFNDVDFSGSNVYGLTQRADDSRAVIAFTHDSVVTNVDAVGEHTEEWCTLVDPR
jgi:hypothetical protein